MTKDLIKHLASEAGASVYGDWICADMMDVRRFATLIAEECAKVCDEATAHYQDDDLKRAARCCAATIRAKVRGTYIDGYAWWDDGTGSLHKTP